ncbi:hypothetical protein [Nocardioides plantarum]|uniref:Uncharacterized protein n=1 Tax=Nocardioides plantarum TaxID=29299 RepID=A0ABV5KEG7_9ACTN|nr:hypothetical protein [Nocardioides plantarum]
MDPPTQAAQRPHPGPASPRSAITEPVDRRLLALLRRAVLEHVGQERRRVHPPVVHVGVPGGVTAALTLGDQGLDHALRTDVLEAMVRQTQVAGSPTLVWLSRSGARETRDVDLAWLTAARAAAAELGRALPMVVVTRRSWLDPSTGVYRDWLRLRA